MYIYIERETYRHVYLYVYPTSTLRRSCCKNTRVVPEMGGGGDNQTVTRRKGKDPDTEGGKATKSRLKWGRTRTGDGLVRA